jgi:hypothetical protein
MRDARGDAGTIKLGPEAQAETVSPRLVWRSATLQKKLITSTSCGARFEPKRTNMKRGSTWGWQKNPFADTRELNGLKVLMILLTNFDAHSGNNRIIYVDTPGVTKSVITSRILALLRLSGHEVKWLTQVKAPLRSQLNINQHLPTGQWFTGNGRLKGSRRVFREGCFGC